MITAEALDIALNMARKCRHAPDEGEIEAIGEVESLLESYEDSNYDEDEYMED